MQLFFTLFKEQFVCTDSLCFRVWAYTVSNGIDAHNYNTTIVQLYRNWNQGELLLNDYSVMRARRKSGVSIKYQHLYQVKSAEDKNDESRPVLRVKLLSCSNL